MTTRKDISIGRQEWIQWIDFDTSSDNLFNIDLLLEPSWYFWTLLEIHCVTECCGIDAYSLWPEDIQKAAEQVNTQDLITKLSTLRSEILKSNHLVVESSKLNNLFNKSVFIQLLDHIIRCLTSELPLSISHDQN